MDIRDLTHDFTNWEWSWSHAGGTLLNGIGLIPGIGMVKNVDEFGTLIKGADKAGDVLKHSDEVGEEIVKNADEIIADYSKLFEGKVDSKAISNMTKSQLEKNIPEGWTYNENNGRMHIKDATKNPTRNKDSH